MVGLAAVVAALLSLIHGAVFDVAVYHEGIRASPDGAHVRTVGRGSCGGFRGGGGKMFDSAGNRVSRGCVGGDRGWGRVRCEVVVVVVVECWRGDRRRRWMCCVRAFEVCLWFRGQRERRVLGVAFGTRHDNKYRNYCM
jgi:hypothetical protein